MYVATKCPIPKSIPNGSVRTTGLTYASLAQYKCDNGYVLSGFKQRQCKSDGAWTGTPPECLQQNRGILMYTKIYAYVVLPPH